jgi:cytochrome P450
MSELLAEAEIPEHVPQGLVMDYPFTQGQSTTSLAHDELVPELQARYPDIFYARGVYSGGGDSWMLMRAEDISRVFRDTEHFSVKGFSPFGALTGGGWHMIPQESDPPQHAAYRAMLNPIFSPRAIAQLKTKIRGYAVKYISRFQDRGECEFMEEFAFEYPITVILEFLGLPQDMLKQFLAWEHDLMRGSSIEAIAGSANAVLEYLRTIVAERRKSPGDDLLSYAMKAEVDGHSLSDIELLGFAFNLYAGGLDTVSTMLGHMFRYLAIHPDLQTRLREAPDLIPAAVEELLRLHAPTTTHRTCVKETTIRGVTIRPGDKIALVTAFGSRDAAKFDRPNELVLNRTAPHLTFGAGNHRCVGMHLARMELTIAFEEFLSRIPHFHIREGATIVTQLPNVIQIDRLPLVWNAGSE